jgi:hypothetical protein
MIAEAIYVLCMLTSLGCALLLLRAHRASRTPFLFWSSICFIGLALNNFLLFVDAILVPGPDLFAILRNAVALAGLGALVYGLVWGVG